MSCWKWWIRALTGHFQLCFYAKASPFTGKSGAPLARDKTKKIAVADFVKPSPQASAAVVPDAGFGSLEFPGFDFIGLGFRV